MKPTTAQLTTRYRKALRAQVDGLKPPAPGSIARLAQSMAASGMKTGELLAIHVRCVIEDILPGLPPESRKRKSRGASVFLASVLNSRVEAGEPQHQRITRDLCGEALELAIENSELHEKVNRGTAAETASRQKEVQLSCSLRQAKDHLEQIRAFSRQILIAQEEERRKISRDLHDVIGQTLTAINIRLVALRKEASLNTKSLAAKIAVAQRLLASSTRIVHQFARELRPAVIEDIGLIPALEGALQIFQRETGIQAELESFAKVESLSLSSRTTLYRVAQEAFTNTARHAQASELKVLLRKHGKSVIMEIADNGKSFNPEERRVFASGSGLGILGMRERLEIAGGRLEIKSAPGHGTRIIAIIPAKDPAS